MIFLSAQPDDVFFLWQLEVMLHNFKQVGIDPACIHILLGVDPRVGLRVEYKALVAREDLAQFFIYPDNRANPRYVSGIRPHIIKQHFNSNPWLEQETLFYHDCDIIFRELPDMQEMEAGNTWYVSDTKSYLDTKYILKYGTTVLDSMCSIVGIDKNLVTANDENAGGAQYILKGTDYYFWDKVENDAEKLFTQLEETNESCATSHMQETGEEADVYVGIQAWCADMWAVLWNGLLRGNPVKISRELDFCWPVNNIERWDECKIFHNAGVVGGQARKYFCKGTYEHKIPHFEVFGYVDKSSCSVKYVEAIYSYIKSTKIILKDTTILIPVRIDSPDRMNNLHTILRYIDTYFETNVTVLEIDNSPKVNRDVIPSYMRYSFQYEERAIYYRTYYNNLLLNMCETPYAAIFDTDVVVPPNQLSWAVEYLRHKGMSLVYPFSGGCYFVDNNFSNLFRRQLDFGVLNNYKDSFYETPVDSYGGAFVVNLATFKRLGMDNINLVGWGPEDQERYKRFKIAGEKIKRIDGPLYHLHHIRKENSNFHNSQLELSNRHEFLKICNMSPATLQEYIHEMKSEGYQPPALRYI